jgi:hypothetical protein
MARDYNQFAKYQFERLWILALQIWKNCRSQLVRTLQIFKPLTTQPNKDALRHPLAHSNFTAQASSTARATVHQNPQPSPAAETRELR